MRHTMQNRSAAQFVIVLALAGIAYANGEVRKDFHFKVGKRPMITIDNPYGAVVVRAGAAHEVTITACFPDPTLTRALSSTRFWCPPRPT